MSAATKQDHVDKSHLDLINDLYNEIGTKPESFGIPAAGRFALISEEEEDYKTVYIHYSVFARRSPVLKAWMETNYGDSQEGVPYRLLCSSVGLQCLVDMVYKQKEDVQLIPVLHECLAVSSELQMFPFMQVFADIMKNQVDLQLNKDFSLLAEWLHCAALFNLDEGKMEAKVLAQLKLLTENDGEKKAMFEEEVTKYLTKAGFARAAQILVEVYPSAVSVKRKRGMCVYCGTSGRLGYECGGCRENGRFRTFL